MDLDSAQTVSVTVTLAARVVTVIVRFAVASFASAPRWTNDGVRR